MLAANDTRPSLLDPREEHFRIPSSHAGLSLFLRHLPPPEQTSPRGVVLYVHGATFPSALSIAHRFDGRSWRDELCAAGFHVWGFDFHGYGHSDPYPAMCEPPEGRAPLCTAEDASREIEQAVRFICDRHGTERISLVAHSWGTIATCRFAARSPTVVDRLVLFGAIARRNKTSAAEHSAWRLVSLQDQWDRFTAEVPKGERPVLSRRHFDKWAERYLDSDPTSRTRTPPSVKTPSGPWHDIGRAWAGDLAYDPSGVQAPVAIIRGEWDSMCSDADAAWLFAAFRESPMRCDMKISRATHLMHLEASRYALYRETQNFLAGGDAPANMIEPPRRIRCLP
jgi:pimeloyl-ACP methyl ester carboxylesterase